MMQTKNCVRCGRPAKFWCGHVMLKNGERIMAGWCSHIYFRSLATGFCGYYQDWMGVVKKEMN